MKRMLKILLVWCMLICVLVSCTPTNNQNEQNDAEDQMQVIIANGKTEYSIVYPSTMTGNYVNAVKCLKDEIESRFGLWIEYGDDKAEYDASKKEILIGLTRYEESQSVVAEIEKDQYAIRAVNNKIVIVAHTNDLLLSALNDYIGQIMEENTRTESGSKVLYHKDILQKAEPAQANFQINGVNLKQFRIVYASQVEGMRDIALKLVSQFNRYCGVRLTCVSDVEAEETQYEILIGETNRAASVSLYRGSKLKLMTYRLVADGSKLMFACGGAYSGDQMLETFISRYLYRSQNGVNITDGTYLERDLLVLKESFASENTTVRVMTTNTAADLFLTDLGWLPATHRTEIHAAVLAVYQPDLIGIQEVDEAWVKAYPYYLSVLKDSYGLDYEWIHQYHRNLVNMTNIIYRKDKVELVDSDVKEFSYQHRSDYLIRVVTWAIFQMQGVDKPIALLNTHWSGSESDSVIEIREECELIASLKATYEDFYLFCTGDFNTHGGGSFEPFKNASGLYDSREVAQANGTLASTHSGLHSVTGFPIDHIFINDDISVLKYDIVNVNNTLQISDHLPQYADYYLESKKLQQE